MLPNNDKMNDGQKRKILRLTKDPITFAETLLKSKDPENPGRLIDFKANYPQRKVMGSKKRNVWICVHRRAGKCVTGDTMIIDRETLRPIPISEAQNVTETLCFDFKTSQPVWAPCQWIKSGQKRCLKLALGTGVSISLSEDHLVYDWRKGWIQAGQVRIGDRLLAPSRMAIFGNRELLEVEATDSVEYALRWEEIPDLVYSLTESGLALFLTKLWDNCGKVFRNEQSVAFIFNSRRLAEQLHHLLLRFEVESAIDEDGNLFIDDPIDRSVFLNMIGVDTPIFEVRSPRRWEIVTEIKKIGLRDVYDLSVDHEDHNFIGNDVVLHNSFSMTILALWHAITRENQQIIVFAPSTTQINAFFEVLDTWIRTNDIVEAMVDRAGKNHSQPYQRRTFITGSYIEGYITGINSSIEGSRRGLTADVVIVDEAQELADEDWKVIDPIIQGDQYRQNTIRAYIAGTINKPVGRFYTKVTKDSSNAIEDIIFIPVDKNPDYSPEMIEQRKLTTEPYSWSTEWMLEVGEHETSVFKKDDIEAACSFHDWQYDGNFDTAEHLVRFIGIDWDKTQAGTNIAVIQYNIFDQSICTLWREEVKHQDFTYMSACKKALEIFGHFRPRLMITDQGQGEMQWEWLYLEAQKPEWEHLQLHDKLIKMPFNKKIELPNPQTGDIEKKLIKPFLVGKLQDKFQQRKMFFPSHDIELKNQFLDYREKMRTENTIKYTSTREHIIDCHLLALYGIWMCYENVLEDRLVKGNFATTFVRQPDSFEDQRMVETFWQNIEGDRTMTSGPGFVRSTFGDFNFSGRSFGGNAFDEGF